MTHTLIRVDGCDNSTCIALDLTDDERALVDRIAAEVPKRGGGCQPVMRVTTDPDDWGWQDVEDEE